jgi:hypothetical protein
VFPLLIPLRQRRALCFHALHDGLVRGIKPRSTSLLLGTITDLAKGKSQLLVENTLLPKPLIILHRVLRASVKYFNQAALHPLGYCWRIPKLIHLSSFFGQSHESGLPCFGSWLRSQPGMHPAEIERGSCEHLLEMHFLQTTVARLT